MNHKEYESFHPQYTVMIVLYLLPGKYMQPSRKTHPDNKIYQQSATSSALVNKGKDRVPKLEIIIKNIKGGPADSL